MKPYSGRRRLTVGRLLYLTWYAPYGFVKKCAQEGPLNLAFAAMGRRAMESAVRSLPSLQSAPTGAPRVFFLSGTRFWYQTAFCAYSLCAHAKVPIQIVIVDDGSLTGEQASQLYRIIPGVQIRWAKEVSSLLDLHLPIERFPTLRQRRIVYPHLRKLTDVHIEGAGWKLALDSDMLFYRRPEFLLEWLENPRRPLHLVDIEESYGYTLGLMKELVGAPIPQRVNVGACGLRSDTINWERLESLVP